MPLLSEQEREQVLVEWNETAAAYPHEQTLPQLFAAQVERSPEAIALVCNDEEMSYRELNARANKLAHRLKRAGSGTGELVGVCLERSVEMVVALLAF